MWSSNRHIKEEQEYYRLLHQYNPLIFSLLYKKIKNRDDILDVFQNVIVHLWQYRLKFSPENIEGSVIKTCSQEIARFYKQETKFNVLDVSIEQLVYTQDSLNYEEKEIAISELEKAIEELIPPLRKKIFKMNKLEGYTQDMISVHLEVSKRTVEYHISKALLFLRNRLKKY